MNKINFEVIEYQGVRFAEVIWSGSVAVTTQFCSPDSSSMQFGLLAHEAGFVESAHFHKPVDRVIRNLPQMLVVQRGKLAVDFFSAEGRKFREILLSVGDAVLLLDGAHSIRVLEDMQCVSVKQGPFLGAENDKVAVTVTKGAS